MRARRGARVAAAGTVPLASCAALSAVRFAPLPVKLFAALFKVTAFAYVPPRLAPGKDPLKLPAVIAYGVAVMCWSGVSGVKPTAPLVLTERNNHRSAPVLNTPPPKSSPTVNSPLLMATALVVSALPIWLPPAAAAKTANCKSYEPVAAPPLC